MNSQDDTADRLGARGRYSRQVFFPEIGESGQRRIRESTVLIVGVGALGSVSAEILARAGVGRIRIVDRDYLDETNLQRQCLFDEADLAAGLPKAVAASRRLRAINSDVIVESFPEDFHSGNARELALGAELIVDGTDNFETRYLINDLACHLGVPWIYSACVSSYGLSYVVRPGTTPCLRCLLEDEPPVGSSPSCETAGVIAPIVHQVSAISMAEALKILSGRSDALTGAMWTLDVWLGQADSFKPSSRRESCPACGSDRNFEYIDGDKAGRATSLCGRNAVQVRPSTKQTLDLHDLAHRLQETSEVVVNEHLLRFRIGGHDVVVFRDGRAIVHGTADAVQARSLYAKFVGS